MILVKEMAVTYADLVAFGFAYVADDISAIVKKQNLSMRERHLPLLSSEDMCVCKEEDFIIFAEFSEVKGPVALFTIPSYVQHDKVIDVNNFIMRIMSVDYQANPGGQFCICQDTQIVQTHISHSRHAYVHYFTLYDLFARGFVRPLCLAYVSSNHRKLHKMFPDLRKHFLKVTEIMKVNNRQHFTNEISSALTTMQNISANSDSKTSDSTCFSEQSISSQERQQQEDLHYMMKVVKSSLVGVEYTLAVIELWHQTMIIQEYSSEKEVQNYLALISSSANQKSVQLNENSNPAEKHLRPIPTLSPWGTPCVLSLLLNIQKIFSCCELSVPVGCFPSLSSQHSISAFSIKDHTGPNAWEAIKNIEFLHLLQAMIVGALDASRPSIDEDNCDQVGRSSSREGTSCYEGSSSYHSFSDSNSDLMVQYSGNQKEFESSFQSSEAVFSDANQENIDKTGLLESFHSLQVSGSPSCPESRDDFYSIADGSPPAVNLSSHSSCPDVGFYPPNDNDDELSSKEDVSSNESESFRDILDNSDDNWSIGSNNEVLPLGNPWDHCLWNRHKPVTKSGHRLLKFFWTYRSSAQHVIFSLLTGRTLVLTGDCSSEYRVQCVMSALSPLVPVLDCLGLRVLRWHQGILVSAHIASYQLIGMCIPERLSVHDMISPRDKNCVTILDVNTGQLLGPAYHGKLLASIGNNVCDFPGDHSLLLYMESILKGIGCKLQAYKGLVTTSECELPSHACRQLDLHGCDAEMIRYLSKLSL